MLERLAGTSGNTGSRSKSHPADGFLVVAHTERDGAIRIISARQATRQERTFYEED
jgi:uncharacterized DUF497 family protein